MEALRDQYEKEVVPALMKKFNYKSVMQVPKLEKIVINIGLGDTKENPKSLENAINDLTLITGQKPVITKAKKAIAAFKIREGINMGCKVTLRSNKMYDFGIKFSCQKRSNGRVADFFAKEIDKLPFFVGCILVSNNPYYSIFFECFSKRNGSTFFIKNVDIEFGTHLNEVFVNKGIGSHACNCCNAMIEITRKCGSCVFPISKMGSYKNNICVIIE